MPTGAESPKRVPHRDAPRIPTHPGSPCRVRFGSPAAKFLQRGTRIGLRCPQSTSERPLATRLFPTGLSAMQIDTATGPSLGRIEVNTSVDHRQPEQISLLLPAPTPHTGAHRFHLDKISFAPKPALRFSTARRPGATPGPALRRCPDPVGAVSLLGTKLRVSAAGPIGSSPETINRHLKRSPDERRGIARPGRDHARDL